MQVNGWVKFLVVFFLPLFVACYKPLSNESLKYLSRLNKPERLAVDSPLMKPLLVKRISGTPENKAVRDFIVDHFTKLGWHIELDEFEDMTPLGKKSFANIIVTQDISRPSRMVLAAHFDSMYSPNFEFIGATDSAVPCGMLMHLAEILDPVLSSTAHNYRQIDKTLQIIFFDGEEAFQSWSDTDSIYGARHLAEKWEKTSVSHASKTFRNKLDQMEVLVLLDLLGAPNVQFPNLHRTTSWLFNKLMYLESRLVKQNSIKTISAKSKEQLISSFNPSHYLTYRGEAIGDDHIPFLARGVNVLHMIPHPFPLVWHTKSDNADAIDPTVVENLTILFTAFVAEYLELDPVSHSEL